MSCEMRNDFAISRVTRISKFEGTPGLSSQMNADGREGTLGSDSARER
jgi:hypothetical protein